MPIGRHHYLRNGQDIFVRDSIVEKVAHGVDEDHFRVAPTKRLRELFGHKSQVEALLVGMPLDAAKTLGERLGITVLAARADLRAAAHWVPGRICPFDGGL